jgi:predicted O-methyltransferase YrrM
MNNLIDNSYFKYSIKNNQIIDTLDLNNDSYLLIDINNFTIKYNKKYYYYKKIIKPNLTFEENLYRIKTIFDIILINSNNKTEINKLLNKAKITDIKYKIRIESKMKNTQLQKLLDNDYPEDTRYMFEILLQIFKPQTIVFVNLEDYGTALISATFNLKYKTCMHSFGEYNIKDLNQSYINFAPLNNHTIYIHGNYFNELEIIAYLIQHNINVDYIYINKIRNLDIIDKLLEYNPNIIIILNLYNKDYKEIVIKKYNPIIIPYLEHLEKYYDTFSSKNSLSHCFCITHRKIDLDYNYIKKPKSNLVKYDFQIEQNITYTNKITKQYLYNKFKYIYDLYKTDLNLFDKHIQNEHIYIIRYMNLIKIGLFYFYLDSHINIYESIFLHTIIKIYLENLNGKFNILEIGCAYGMSGMIIANSLVKYGRNKACNFISIDPNQKTQWHNVGSYNINKIINNKYNIKWKLIEQYSHDALKYIKNNYINNNKLFDIVFVDGAHDYANVYGDLVLIDKILKTKGIIILDDVLHMGVKDAVLLFFTNNTRYIKLSINNNLSSFNFNTNLYPTNFIKKNIYNPGSMYAFMKI